MNDITIDDYFSLSELTEEMQNLKMVLLKEHLVEDNTYSPNGHAEFNREVARCNVLYPSLFPFWAYMRNMYAPFHGDGSQEGVGYFEDEEGVNEGSGPVMPPTLNEGAMIEWYWLVELRNHIIVEKIIDGVNTKVIDEDGYAEYDRRVEGLQDTCPGLYPRFREIADLYGGLR